MLLNPNLLSPKSDPKHSIRYTDVDIVLNKIQSDNENVIFEDFIEEDNRFIIKDYSPLYKFVQIFMFRGTVIQEQNGTYSWWRDI